MTLLNTPTPADHLFGYNRVDRNTSYRTPLSGSYTYMYDRDSRLIRTILPSGGGIAKKVNGIITVKSTSGPASPSCWPSMTLSTTCSCALNTLVKEFLHLFEF